MRKSEVDLLIEESQEKEKYFRDYLKYAKIIKKEAEKLLGKVKVLIFGSILKKEEVAQDIDILIISSKLKTLNKKSKIRAKLKEKIGFSAPFEFHLINPKEYKEWYSHFIEEKIEI
jgi:predicted nucleotidyltransferase